MRNNRSFWFVSALLVAGLTACASAGSGTTSSLSAVTPQVKKALYSLETVVVYNAANTDAGVVESGTDGMECWTPASATIAPGKKQTFTPATNACTDATLTANSTAAESTECQTIFSDDFGYLYVNNSASDCTWGFTTANKINWTYKHS